MVKTIRVNTSYQLGEFRYKSNNFVGHLFFINITIVSIIQIKSFKDRSNTRNKLKDRHHSTVRLNVFLWVSKVENYKKPAQYRTA